VRADDERSDAGEQEQQNMGGNRIKPSLPKPAESAAPRLARRRKQVQRNFPGARPDIQFITHGTGCEKSIFACLSESVNSLGKRLQFLAGFEAHGLPGRNAHFSARPGVAADSRFAGPDVKDTKAAKLNAVAPGESLLHGLKHRLDSDFRFGFGDAGAIYNVVNDIKLYQTNLLKTLVLS